MANLRLLARVGLRNLSRNTRRTVITGIGVALGVGLCIASYGIVDGLDQELVHSVTRQSIGDVQLHAPDYLSKRRLALNFEEKPVLAALATVPAVVASAPRAYGWGFLAAGSQTSGVSLMGIDPTREAGVTELAKKIVQGAPLPNQPTPWREPHALDAAQVALDQQLTQDAVAAAMAEIDGNSAPKLAPTDLKKKTQDLVNQVAPGPLSTPPIVLGVKLARRLGVSPGQVVSLTAQANDGALSEVSFKVVGVLRTGNDAADRTQAVVELADLQHLIRIGDKVHELALRLADGADPKATVAALVAQPPLSKLDVKDWTELRPEVTAMVAANDELMGTLLFVALLVAAIGVVNTMLMALFDRKKELGVLKAVGMRPRSIVGMVLLETALLALAASIAGLAIGVLLDLYLKLHGLDLRGLFGNFSLSGVALDPVLRASITARGLAIPVVSIIGAAVVSAVIPAWSAARTEAAVAMREVS